MQPAVIRFAIAFSRAAALAVGVVGSATSATLDNAADAVLGQAGYTTAAFAPLGAASLKQPRGMVDDPVTGAFWVADTFNNRVLRYPSSAAFASGAAADLVLGQPNFTSNAGNGGGAVGPANMSLPSGVAMDQAGRLYVVDSNNHRLLIFAPPFSSGMAATHVVGQADFTSGLVNRGGATGAATFSTPLSAALDGSGNLYVADPNNNRVLKFNAPVTTGATATRVYGQLNFTATNPSTSELRSPVSVAMDAAGNLYVADFLNDRVVRYSGGNLSSIPDMQLCLSSSFLPIGAGPDRCLRPSGVAVDAAGSVYVADGGNHRVMRYAPPISGVTAGTVVTGNLTASTGVCNQGLAAPTAGSLCFPWGVWIDRNSNLLVSDEGNHRVLRFDIPRARPVPTLASLSPSTLPQGGVAFTLTVNGTGFQSDSVVNWNGSPRTTRYISGARLAANIPASDIAAAGPYAVTVSTPAPGGGSTLLVNVSSYATAPLDAVADRVLGQPDFVTAVVNNPVLGDAVLGPIRGRSMNGPGPLAIDRVSGRLFVTQTDKGRVASWASAASFQNADPPDVILGEPDEFSSGCAVPPTAATFCFPLGIATDDAGALYVSDSANNRVLRFAPPFSTGMAATRVFGQGGAFTTSAANNGGVSANSLSSPGSVAYAGGTLFVADSDNNRILVYPSPLTSTTASVAIGQAGLTTNAAGSGATGFNSAVASTTTLAVDGAGAVYATLSSENRILRFTPPFANAMPADLVLGQPTFATTAGGTTATTFKAPLAMTFDGAGALLVADFNNHRVMRFASPFSNGMAATGVIGQSDFTSGASGLSASKLNSPAGLASDSAGNLYVSDFFNYRILAFDRPFVTLASRLANISTRMQVLTGNDVLIGGFIIQGNAPKTVVVRARGPSLVPFGIANALLDPTMQLFSGQTVLATSDNFGTAANLAALNASGFAPSDSREAAILTTLSPGAYTAVVSGAGNTTGVGIIEVFEVDRPDVPLANISTRGQVLTGNDVMIGGFVIQGEAPQTVIVRARGPSLVPFGITNALADPVLQLFSGQTVIASNDDWQSSPDAASITARGFAPSDAKESVILITLQPGAYTAIVSGKNGGTGVGIIEVFAQ